MSMLASANGSAKALPTIDSSVWGRLAIAAHSAASRPTVSRTTPGRRVAARARAGMSPSPVPTSSKVTWRGSSGSMSVISRTTASAPPKSALASATSRSERRPRCGSRSGASRTSTLSRRRPSTLELCVPTSVVEQWSARVHFRVLDFADKHGVIAAGHHGRLAAFQVRHNVLEDGSARRTADVADAVESVQLRRREPPGQRFLVGRQHVHGEVLLLTQDWVHRRIGVDAYENERRCEAEGAKRAHSQSVVAARAIARGDDRDARGKPSECAAKRVWIDAHEYPRSANK